MGCVFGQVRLRKKKEKKYAALAPVSKY